MTPRLALLLSAALLLPAMVGAGERISEASDRTGLSLTIYNKDLALVRERREVELPAGVVDLAIRGVSGRMQAETVLLQGGDGRGGLEVLEQNFNYDLLTPAKLLEKYLGREIRIRRTNPATGEEQTVQAKVLSTQDGLVVRIGDRIETNPGGRYIFDGLPPNLRNQPTLVTRLENEIAGPRTLELSYLSGGLGWKADYVAHLDREERKMELAGWVTLTNTSEADYRDARLQLVAGEVHRIRSRTRPEARLKMMAAVADQVQEESLFDYHLYTLPRKTTLLNRQTKQVALLNASGVPVRKHYRVNGDGFGYGSRDDHGRKLPVGVYLTFDNRSNAHLGLPLPAGVMRIYKADSRGGLQFIGEDRIDHTPKGEQVQLKLGNAFDVTARRVQTAHVKQHPLPPYKSAVKESYRIELQNAGKGPIQVEVRESMPGDWKITQETQSHEKLDAHRVQWVITVPPNGQATVEYTTLIRW